MSSAAPAVSTAATGCLAAEPARLIPDANFSRNVSFHVVENLQGDQIWIGRYLADLLEVVAECHPEGLLVDIDGMEYLLTVAPAPQEDPHG